MKLEEAFYIGYITKTKGLKGEVQVYFEYDSPELLDLDVVFAEISGKMVPYFVSVCKLQNNQTANICFDDIDHIDKAQALVKKKIYLPLDKMPDRSDDDFHYNDLIGFMVTDETLGELGEILDVNEYPQHFVATMNYKEKEVLFPLNEDMILEIDLDEETILVDLPEGLLDLYLTT
ncbi:ribosome maturation factor RimM [Pedobacter quisquiliarum]|jgi:16S rRNA processing protein RimM|uniref:Ribosome maturation factor RimM n=1 Tax=Pedobacter quisquiliarum TaxID=1834438 RepID=A0A916X9Y0_9SPHI|nr:ribosome maturation factor RimM [Pedobacter quisquiliarum]GGC55746.1 ribosome maturation factor RimM [Pedobacter quisquiliarum]|eukprot:TRINITY_DN4023_c0_g2_i1.p2 TRINITY_DN4023_c0_g2~~TRINITY_DN4023_c0_g2_i1.p2  ORF type:complete len:176 (+),score=50.16 TRINITY_DN4023_c0_g2_i1:160-687(+)